MATDTGPEEERAAARLPGPQRRRQLLDVASRAFAAGGYHGTSMDEVAEAAGVTKPVLYQHFRSKRQLYVEVLDDAAQRLVVAIAEAAGGPQDPGRVKVERGMVAYFELVADNEPSFRLLFGGGTKRDTEFAGVVARVEDTLAEVVARLIDADIDAEHRQVLGHAIVGMAEGACRRWLASPDPVPPKELAREVAELAWAGLRGVSRG